MDKKILRYLAFAAIIFSSIATTPGNASAPGCYKECKIASKYCSKTTNDCDSEATACLNRCDNGPGNSDSAQGDH